MTYEADTDFPGFADLDELPPGREPAVFMFQPDRFESVAPDRLLEWEQTLVDRYDLPRLNFDDQKILNGATWSNSGGPGEICADDSDYQDSGDGPTDADDGANDARRPAIFMWQPSRFLAVPSERLADWERVLRNRVGIPADGLAADQGGGASLSATRPNDCMDDTDYQPQF